MKKKSQNEAGEKGSHYTELMEDKFLPYLYNRKSFYKPEEDNST